MRYLLSDQRTIANHRVSDSPARWVITLSQSRLWRLLVVAGVIGGSWVSTFNEAPVGAQVSGAIVLVSIVVELAARAAKRWGWAAVNAHEDASEPVRA